MKGTGKYIVCGMHPWSREIYDLVIPKDQGEWVYSSTLNELKSNLPADRIFFIHWSEKVPPEIINKYECIGFHMTDLPYGRGGSPLQNLIVRGHTSTMHTAFRMTNELDAGPVYLKRPLLLHGPAEAIYYRTMRLAAEMIHIIISENPAPTPQEGVPVFFERRTPEDSEIPSTIELRQIYDWIRMLDAPEYPHAFIKYGPYHIEFTRARYSEKYGVVATVVIRS